MARKFFEFTFKLETTSSYEELPDLLYEAGCDDALFSEDATGVYLYFCREATSIEKAIASAITDVFKCPKILAIIDIGRIKT